MKQWRLEGVLLVAAALLAIGCKSSDVREWEPSDHDNAGSGLPATPQPKSTTRPAAPTPPLDEEVMDVWLARCARCHGAQGRGDGPDGAMFRPPDFTRTTWQASATDRIIRETIRNGRGRMPAFRLPTSMVDGLVEHVRRLGPPVRPPVAAPTPSSSAAPSSSATPSSSARPAPSASARPD